MPNNLKAFEIRYTYMYKSYWNIAMNFENYNIKFKILFWVQRGVDIWFQLLLFIILQTGSRFTVFNIGTRVPSYLGISFAIAYIKSLEQTCFNSIRCPLICMAKQSDTPSPYQKRLPCLCSQTKPCALLITMHSHDGL